MNVQSYPTLTDMMRKAPIAPETVSELRDRSLQALDQAVDVFFHPEREVAEGKAAYARLADVETALRVYESRHQQEAHTLNEELQQKEYSGPNTDVSVPVPTSAPYRNGICRTRTYNSVSRPSLPAADSSVGALVEQFAKTLPAYASVAMVPGPLAVSLKDLVKETFTEKMRSGSFSRTVSEETYGLFGLGHKSSNTVSSTSSSRDVQLETSSVDERVLTGLQALRNGIEQLEFVAPLSATVVTQEHVEETQEFTKSDWSMFGVNRYPDHTYSDHFNKLAQVEAPYAPASLDAQGRVSNAGLSAPTPGADLVDLVEQAQDLTPALADTLSSRGRAILDEAITTLFTPTREVKDGRKSYDQLTNLNRALKLAFQRFRGPFERGSARLASSGPDARLSEQLAALDQVIPLYACVAMVPGQLSSSVKNYAKTLGTVLESSSSSSLTRGAASGHSSSVMDSASRFETLTADETIMPRLHELSSQLATLQVGHCSQGMQEVPYLAIS